MCTLRKISQQKIKYGYLDDGPTRLIHLQFGLRAVTKNCGLCLFLFAILSTAPLNIAAQVQRVVEPMSDSEIVALNSPKLVVPVGHSGWGISSLSFSPDGQVLASGSADKTVKLWEIATGRELKTLGGHSDRVLSIAFSPDGKTLVSGSADKSLTFWDVASGTVTNSIVRYADYVTAVAFSPNGKLLAFGGSYTTILWDMETSKVLKSLPGSISWITSLVFSPDGKTLVVGGGDQRITLWDVATGGQLNVLRDHKDSVWSVAFSPKGDVFASGSADKTIKIRDRGTGAVLKTLVGHSDAVADVAFSGDGKLLVSGSNDHTMKLWDVATGQLLRTITDENSIGAVAISPDGKTIASGDYGSTVKLWDVSTGNQLRALVSRASYVYSLASSGAELIASGGLEGQGIKLWNLKSGQLTRTLPGHSDSVTHVAFSRDGKTLASGGEDHIIKLWDTSTGEELKVLTGHNDRVRPLVFSPSGMILASGSDDRTIRLWNVATGKELKSLRGHRSWIGAIAFSPDGTILASGGGGDNQLKFWDVASGRELRTIDEGDSRLNGVTALAFSPDGATLASASQVLSESGNRIKLRDSRTGELIKLLAEGPSEITSLAFSSDGSVLASENVDRSIDFWNVTTRLRIDYKELPGWKGRDLSYSLITKGQTLAFIEGEGNRIILWNTVTRGEIATLIALDTEDWVVVTPDGRFDTSVPLDDVEALYWSLLTDPFKIFPLEIFMRQYYEPGLLRKTLDGEQLKLLPSIADINRVQPKLEIKEIRAANGLANVVVYAENIDQEVRVSATDPTKKKRYSSGVYDLRLFRDGQLVGYSTSDEKVQSTFRTYKNFDDDLAVWREANKVELADGKKTFTFTVKLPANSNKKDIEFSAYAFNEDRVKSETARLRWSRPETSKPSTQPNLKPRAYVIAVGVNANENPAFDLQFAANDARRFQEVLPQRLAATGDYSEVVPISLISDWELRRGQKVTTKSDATKVNFKAVLDLLAGRPVADEIKRAIPNADKLAKTTPDDMVLILFSSHGYADQNGNFYFIPYDTGPGACSVFTETVRQRSISSDELSLWLRDVDAGQMTLIVDACYSTAAIEGSGFKPGPMGSRGLGQLAYDKRMRILTATQADNVAMEMPATAKGQPINHGLLSYALLEDGLGANKADFKPQDKTIFLDEWLEYAVADVPKLFANQPRPLNETQPTSRKRNDRPRLVLLKRHLADPGACGLGPSAGPSRTQEQQPSLFDFTRRKREVALVRNP